MNPIIKFTTLFGLLAVELAVSLSEERGPGMTHILAAIFVLLAMYFVWRSLLTACASPPISALLLLFLNSRAGDPASSESVYYDGLFHLRNT